VSKFVQGKVEQVKHTSPLVLISTLLGAILFSAMIAFVIRDLYREDSTLFAQLTHANLLSIVLSFVFYSCALALAILGWSLIASRMTNVQDLKRHSKVYCYTNLARRIPGFLWHIAGRVYLYRRDGVDIVPISAASAVEMVLIILSGLISYALWNLGRWPARWRWGLVLGISVGMAMIHPSVLRWVLRKVRRADIMEHIQYRDVSIWLIIYVSVWLLGGLTLLSVIYAIQPVDLGQAPGIIAAWSLSGAVSTLVVFLPAGLGIREATLSVLLLPFIPAPLAVTVALAVRILLTLYEVVWALVVILV